MDQPVVVSRKQLELLYRHLSGMGEALGILRSLLYQKPLTATLASASHKEDSSSSPGSPHSIGPP